MTDLASRLSRAPRPFDSDMAAEARAACGWADPAVDELIAGTAGCSPFLAGLIGREGDWLEAACADPEAAVAAELAAMKGKDAATLGPQLRRAKRRVALIAALADLGGAWPLEEVTGSLTRLADAALQAGLEALLAPEIARGKLPGMGEDDIESGAGMALFAMGKMGAFELNYSSDIDLICLYDETRYEGTDQHEARSVLVRVTRKLAGLIGDITGEGYVFRTDLRLRPDAAVTPVCLSMGAAEQYYESVGRTWSGRPGSRPGPAPATSPPGPISSRRCARSSGGGISISMRSATRMTCGSRSATTRVWAARSACRATT